MSVRSTVFRVAALVLLLLAGGELFACEILYPDGCESDRVPGSQRTQSDDDCCICCCAHIVIVQPSQPDIQQLSVSDWVEPDTGIPLDQPFHIYHPPKS